MSISDKENSSVEDTSGGVGDDHDHDDEDDDDDEENSGGVHQKRDGDGRRTKERGRGYGKFSGFSRNLGKAKKFVLKPLLNKKLSRKSSKSSASGKRVEFDGGGKGCFYCFRPNPSGESGIGSHTSDPYDPTFTYDMLRDFMEKSDFYSKECNTHLDSDLYCAKD